MVFVLLSSLGASTPPRAMLEPGRGVTRCVSTAVDTKAAWCERQCASMELTCTARSCLCVATPDEAEHHARMSDDILMRLAARMKRTPARDKAAEMEAARQAAARLQAAAQLHTKLCVTRLRHGCGTLEHPNLGLTHYSGRGCL